MNNQIENLINHIKTSVRTINYRNVRECVNKYFNTEVWSLEKDEWNKMSNDEKKNFIETLIKNIENPDENRVETIPNENPIENTEIDLELNNEEFSKEVPEENDDSSVLELLEKEKQELLLELANCQQKIKTINDRLLELGHQAAGEGLSKKSQMKLIYDSTTSRKDFITKVVESKLAGKAYASTAYQSFKTGK